MKCAFALCSWYANAPSIWCSKHAKHAHAHEHTYEHNWRPYASLLKDFSPKRAAFLFSEYLKENLEATKYLDAQYEVKHDYVHQSFIVARHPPLGNWLEQFFTNVCDVQFLLADEMAIFCKELMRWIPKWKKGIPFVLYQHIHVHCGLQIVSQELEFSFSKNSWKCGEQTRDENMDSTVYDPTGYCALTAFRNVYVQPAHCPIDDLHMKDLIFYDFLPSSLADIVFEYACSRLRYFKFIKS
jgi:hypothetical protein